MSDQDSAKKTQASAKRQTAQKDTGQNKTGKPLWNQGTTINYKGDSRFNSRFTQQENMSDQDSAKKTQASAKRQTAQKDTGQNKTGKPLWNQGTTINYKGDKDSAKKTQSPRPVFQTVQEFSWENVDGDSLNRKPVNKHTGVYAYHMDDCMCGMVGWPCRRDGSIWSCCGQSLKYCMCTGTKK